MHQVRAMKEEQTKLRDKCGQIEEQNKKLIQVDHQFAIADHALKKEALQLQQQINDVTYSFSALEKQMKEMNQLVDD